MRQMPGGTVCVNVGVWNGFTFLVGMIANPDKVCIRVDNFSEFGGSREARPRSWPPHRRGHLGPTWRTRLREPIGEFVSTRKG